jgi:hypothetical protein
MDSFPIVKRKDEEAYGEYRLLKKISNDYNSLINDLRKIRS